MRDFRVGEKMAACAASFAAVAAVMVQDKQIAENKSRLTGIKEQRGKEIAAARKQMTASAR
ncbi:hypothetical protein [Streptomyces swartbergensis]|uniref:Uncharacterized protein n=1 Tax=Streptomyces swartbergensis TaxID=487165 RepID=A0A243S174_9ACTN|nr:hypothetical protein [Streptomyces swartbergensis]OUD01301.1 hypothetical protein CA983_20915 [Streptomyces swartbergensis]